MDYCFASKLEKEGLKNLNLISLESTDKFYTIETHFPVIIIGCNLNNICVFNIAEFFPHHWCVEALLQACLVF
jgi:hypothetical protein